MCGVTSETTSPSVRNTSRSTPCVLGCCGPMLTSISSVRTSNSITRGSSKAVAMVFRYLLSADAVIFQRHFIVFTQWMADPVFGAEDATQAGMAGEADAAQIKHFALVPIGGFPNVADGWHLWQFTLDIILPTRQHDLEHKAHAVRHAPQVINDFCV